MRFLAVLVFIMFSLSSQGQDLYHDQIYAELSKQAVFPFGIASGDPTDSSIVLWTTVLPSGVGPHPVAWKICSDSSMYNVVQSGRSVVSEASGFSVQVEVTGLAEGSSYFYQFSYRGSYSAVGRTRTFESNPAEIKLAVVSCADFQSGHFNAYRHIASRKDLAAVIHLGDYIYETSAEKWGPKKQRKRMFREHVPDHVLFSLRDYRSRYAQYRQDRDLQEAHRLHPFIAVWDDHEFSNNAHSEMQSGRQLRRRAAAKQAYFEWLPIRQQTDGRLYRKFSFGFLAELWMLDTRQEGRMEQAESEQDPQWQDPNRTILGTTQASWLMDGMQASSAQWKILGNQVIFSPLHDSRVFSRIPAVKMDRWDGYPAARDRLFAHWNSNRIENVIVLTGDVHTSWALELREDLTDDPETSRDETRNMGVELVTPSISSFNFNELLPRPIAWEAERRFKKKKHNPHLKYLDLIRHGYLTLHVQADIVQGNWLFFNPKKLTTKVQQERTYGYERNTRILRRVR